LLGATWEIEPGHALAPYLLLLCDLLNHTVRGLPTVPWLIFLLLLLLLLIIIIITVLILIFVIFLVIFVIIILALIVIGALPCGERMQ